MVRRLLLMFIVIFIAQTGFVLAADKPGAPAKKAPVAKKASADRKAPVVNTSSSLSPMNNGLINNAKPTISAEYVDEGIGVSPTDTKLYIDGQDVSATAQVLPNKITYVPALPLPDGGHKVRLDVADKAGNVETTTWSFTIHTKPPVVKITSHKLGQFVNRSPVLITGTINDSRARIVVNGISASVERDIFSARVNLVEGSNMITAVATDSFGNTGSDAVNIVVDTKPPVIEILTPTASSLLNVRTVTVTGIADKNAATVSVGTRAGGEPVVAELAAGRFTAKDVKLEEGMNTITVKAVSQAGNTGTAAVKVTVDSIPPRVMISTPKDMTVTNRKTITITGTIDKTTAQVKVNNTPVQVSRGMFTLSGLNLVEGTNAITATAIDRAGNQAKPSVVNVVLDTTPPTAPVLAPMPPVTRAAQITVSGTAEPGAHVELYVNSASKGTMKADDKGAFTHKVTMTEGNNAITATATDAPGNTSAPSAVQNVFLDTKPPKIL